MNCGIANQRSNTVWLTSGEASEMPTNAAPIGQSAARAQRTARSCKPSPVFMISQPAPSIAYAVGSVSAMPSEKRSVQRLCSKPVR